MALDLIQRCGTCGSWKWCGRSCSSERYRADQTVVDVVVDKAVASTNVVDRPYPKYADPEKRRAYLRDYQRKRRAALAKP